MKQGLIKGLLMLSIMNCLITACSKEDSEPNGLKKEVSYTFPEAESGTTLYDGTGPQWQNKPFEAQWVVNNQVVGNTRVEFVWAIPVTNHIWVASYPNEIVFDWLIKMSGNNIPVIKDADWNNYCFEYKGKSDNCQYYEYSEEFMRKVGCHSEYGVYINDEFYTVDFIFAELPTATYDRKNEIFILHLKVSGLLLSRWHLKDYVQEKVEHQYSQPLEMTLVTTKSLPYSY